MTLDPHILRALAPLKQQPGCILVTGANGFIGRAVCRALAAAGLAWIEFDRHFDDGLPGGPHCRMTGDITDASGMEALFAEQRITHIVHGGGISGPAVAPGNPALVHRVNLIGTLNLLEAAARYQVTRFVLLSSIAAYGNHPTRMPVAEDAPLLATDPYGASKLAAESIARSYRETAALDVIALRLASVYGPGRRVPCIVGALHASAHGGPAATVSAPEKNPRQLLYIDDCVAAILLSLAAPARPLFAYNIATGHCISESEVAAEAAAIDHRVTFIVNQEDKFSDSHLGPLRTDAARRDLGFEAVTGLRQGMQQYWRARQLAGG